jgi:hypothetical protein
MQRLIERLESFAGLVQLPIRGRMLVENLADSRRRLAICECVLHSGTRRDHRSGGLLDEVLYVLALRKHLGEELNRHEFEFRILRWTASYHSRLRN